MSNQIIVRYQGFEILCKVDTVTRYRQNILSKDKVLISDEIFKSVQKGSRASASDLQKTFGTLAIDDCIETILLKGEYQVSANERRELTDQKRQEIIQYIKNHFVDPKTKLPIPVTRIESALDSMKAKFDYNVPTDKLLQPILKKLPEIIPVRRQTEVRGIVKIPHQFTGVTYGLISSVCKVETESFDGEGRTVVVSLIPNDYDKLLTGLNKLTEGEFSYEPIVD